MVPMNSKTKILQALEGILLSDGAAAVTVRSVCQKAGVNHGLVPHYFGNKEGLLTSGLQFIANRKIKELLQAAHDPDSAKIAEKFAHALTDDNQFPQVLMEFSVLARQSSKLAQVLGKLIASRTQILATAFGLKREQAMFFQSSIIGIQVMKSMCGKDFVAPAAQELFTRLHQETQISPERVEQAIHMIENQSKHSKEQSMLDADQPKTGDQA